MAAGLSSRMKEFKPVLRLNGFPMIQMTVQSMKNAGVEKIVVVTGYRGQEIVRALKDEDVILAENKEYAVTDMLTSAKIGIQKTGRSGWNTAASRRYSPDCTRYLWKNSGQGGLFAV